MVSQFKTVGPHKSRILVTDGDTPKAKRQVVEEVQEPTSVPVKGMVELKVSGAEIADIPGIPKATRGTGFMRATDIPDLSAFLAVNPRAPKPAGTVPKAIIQTLTTTPSQMVLKNAGLYLLVGKMEPGQEADTLTVELKDPHKHGLVNGGHTYAMIRQVMATGTPEDFISLGKAYVPVNIYSGIPDELIVEMASGLNHTRQVQEASLEHLRGHYDQIKKVMDKELGGDQIAYYEGDAGSVPIGDVLAFIEMFNLERYPLNENPYGLYAHRSRVIAEASEDFSTRSDAIHLVISKLPDILRLVDTIKRDVQAVRQGEVIQARKGRKKPPPNTPDKSARILLPFLGERVQERLPNGWLYPILAAFRANVHWDLKGKRFHWKEPNGTILKQAALEFVAICNAEQRNAGNKPEWVGKRESAYRQCKTQVDLAVLKHK